MKELQGGTKENCVPRQGVIRLPSGQIKDFSPIYAPPSPNILLLATTLRGVRRGRKKECNITSIAATM